MRQFLAVSLVLLFVCDATLGAPAGAEGEIQDLYRRALSGDKAAVNACITKLEALLKNENGNQLARVYLGSAYTLRSRDMGFGPAKLRTLKQGVAVMNEAVAAAPDDAKVRLARALTTSALPRILGYAGESRKDFEELAKAARQHPEKFTESDLATIREHAR